MTRVYVIHPALRNAPPALRSPEGRLEEALGLAEALDVAVVGGAVAPLANPRPGTLLGEGKIDEFRPIFEAEEIDLVIIDGPLSPVQQRNLEKAWNVKILDRTGLILEIFGDRARTREGVLQVELAHLTYQRSRLVRSWTHLERQRGGLGFVGGPGETQIEADRRMIDERILRIRKQLEKVVRTRGIHRAARKRVPYPIVALVGYTNAGKSTLFNRLTSADVMAEDMLFATLDPTMRGLVLPSGRKVILSDTVGFVADLPTALVAAFRATLEEVLEADLVVHVRDAANPDTDAQRDDVLDVLKELGVAEDRFETMIEAYNKLDLLPDAAAEAWRHKAARDPQCVALSAHTGAGVEGVVDAIEAALSRGAAEYDLTLGPEHAAALAWLYRRGAVLSREDEESGETHLRVRLSDKDAGAFDAEYALLGLIPPETDW